MKKPENGAAALRRVLSYIGIYKIYLAASIAFAAASVALTLYIPVLTGRAVDLIVAPGRVDFAGVGRILAGIAASALATALLQWLMSLCGNRLTYNVVRDLRRDAFAKIERLPLAYIDSHPHGELVSRVIADADQLADGLLMGFTQLFTGVATILGALLFMLRENAAIALVVILITPVSLLVAAYIAKSTFSMFRLQGEARGEQTAMVNEFVGEQKVVQAFDRGGECMREFDEVNERLRSCSLKAIFFSSVTNPATRFVNSLVYMGVAFVGALAVMRGRLSVGRLTCFLSYANQYTKPFNEISGVVTELQNALACAARLFELIDETPQTPDAEDALVLTAPDGSVELDNVSFSYRPEQRLLENVNVSVRPGQRTAIVGPTGCGKTTLINLLMRFYEPCGGEIRVSGTDIRRVTRASLRRSYGMVLQEVWLKEGSIRENIAMGRPDASDEEVVAAAKAAHADSFIRRLPRGYDTVIGPDGGSLSQGQKQLLCISRVMLCLPPMLILDEATSSIDARTELRVQRAFAKMMKGRTSFIIAHRLSTIKDADLILVMKDGNIIEQGSHDELLARGGFYSELYNSQYAEAE